MSPTTDTPETNPKSLSPDEASPASLGGSAQAADVEPSPLERLIAQSTSEQAAAASTPFFLEEGNALYHDRDDPNNSDIAAMPTLGRTVATLVAGSLCLVQMGLVWASFLSKAWFETHMAISVDGTGFSTDQLLQTTTLASLLSVLLGNDQGWPAMILVLTCLILPCFCMILNPSWTVGDYQTDVYFHSQREEQEQSRRRRGTQPSTSEIFWGVSPRRVAELVLFRLPFLAFFLLVVMDLGTSSLAFESNHTHFVIHNRTKGGLVAYALGIACSLGAVLVLRLANHAFYQSTAESLLPSPRSPWFYGISQFNAASEQPLAPPSQAFDLQRPLLPTGNGEDPATWDETEVSDTGNAQGSIQQRLSPPGSSDIDDLPLWKKVLVYEMGILAATLWIPTLFLPIFEVTFDGIVATFMKDGDLEVHFHQIPGMLWQNGIAAGTDLWVLIALGVVLLLLTVVLPMLATGLSLAYWRSPAGTRISWFYGTFLQLVQPCLGGVVLALAVGLAIPALEPLGNFILNAQTSGFCQKFENITNTSCLTIHGEPRLGHWFLLAQSLSLEILVMLVLAFKPPESSCELRNRH